MRRAAFRQLLSRARDCETGAAAIEFAIVATVFIFFTLGIVEIGRALDARNQISRGADAGARAILVPKSANFQGEAEKAAKAALTTADPDGLVVTVDTNGDGYRVLTLTYEFKPIFVGIFTPMPFTVERLVCPETECKAP